MLKTLRITWDIQKSYQVNSILYSLKQMPILKKLLPEQLYQVRGLKIFAAVLSFLWGVLKLFGAKALYFVFFLSWPLQFYPKFPEQQMYLHLLCFLTVTGAIINTDFADGSYEQYYAVNLLRMDAKSYILTQFGWEMAKMVLGFLPFSLLLGQMHGVPLWLCLLFPFCAVGGKVFYAAQSLRRFTPADQSTPAKVWFRYIGAAVLVIAAYALPLTGLALPVWLSTTLLLLMILQGAVSLPVFRRFRSYRQLNQQALTDFFQTAETLTSSAKNSTRDLISEGGTVSSSKKGFEYLNELFIKRHRKLLWRTTCIISGVCGALVLAGAAALLLFPDIRPDVREVILHTLPFWSFILYFINRGTGFTRAMFINCDHSLLTYSFYKQPKTVLKLFQIRLREITKINAVPALILGLGLDVLLLLSGGGTWGEYLIIFLTLLSMSLFFSIHYLTLYYLLQPYNAGTEIKSGTYQFITGATYFVCYLLMRAELPFLPFGLLCIGFCLTYSVLACVLVYRIAPKTFRIRQ